MEERRLAKNVPAKAVEKAVTGKKTKRRLKPSKVLILVGVVLCVVYLGVTFVQQEAAIAHIQDTQQQTQKELDEAKQSVEELTRLKEYVDSTEYVEGEARHTLGMLKPGEQLFLPKTSAASTGTNE